MDRDHLCTPVGLLFNEIVMSPNIILATVLHMLERVVDMDAGKYSELGESILYVTRLAIRVEGYLLFLMRNKKFHAMQKSAHLNPLTSASTYEPLYTITSADFCMAWNFLLRIRKSK